MKQTLNDRMKKYESINEQYLIPNMHNVIRLDGKAFSKFTKQFEKPFSDTFIRIMNETAKYLCENIQGAKYAYIQSDEISIYFTDTDTYEQQLWFGGRVQKIVSVAASMASAKFNHLLFIEKMQSVTSIDIIEKMKLAEFDARVFQLPNKEELINCFIWRQRDCIKNSISTVAQHNFSTKELHKKSTKDMLVMLSDKNIIWDDLSLDLKNGRKIKKETYINGKLVGDGFHYIWHQPTNDSVFFESKQGRALEWSEEQEEWCDIEIKTIKTFWDISGTKKFEEIKYEF